METMTAETVGYFTDNLMKELMTNDVQGNLVISPIGLVTVLIMTLAGARGTTFDQLAQSLNVKKDEEDKLHQVFHRMISRFDQKFGKNDRTESFSGYNMSIRSIALAAPPVSQDYVDFIEKNYNSKVERLHGNNLISVMARINDWVSKSTDGRIKKMLDNAPVPTTRLILANSVAFEGAWAEPFNKTRKETFLNDGNDEVAVDMMTGVKFAHHAIIGDVQMIELPYEGSASMLIIMPQSSGVDAIVADGLSTLASRFDEEREEDLVQVTMPEFKTSSSLDVLDKLASLGVTDLTDPSKADLGRMTGNSNKSIYLQQILHKTHIDVDKDGSSATSSTVASFAIRSIREPSVTMTINRPFVFMIRDTVAKTVLFTGAIAKL